MIQSDIEIYVKSVSPDAVKAWLETVTVSLDVQSSNPKRQAYWATFADAVQDQQKEFEIIVLNKVQSNFSSIWFNTKNTPWATDKACAQAAFAHFNSAIRCVVSGWQEGDSPDQWLHIDSEGEEVIDWI
ncbi:MAG: hypothetical protein KC426_08435 [Oceanospirillaceae bacterium]|nr:hypothetical protein [Oceanospirillaceae bacterium]